MFLHVILNSHKMQKKLRCTVLTVNDAHIRNLSGKKKHIASCVLSGLSLNATHK